MSVEAVQDAVAPVAVTFVNAGFPGVLGAVVSAGPGVGASPPTFVLPSNSVMWLFAAWVEPAGSDQSLDGSQVPAEAMRNCTSRRHADCPAGAMFCPAQLTVT